MSTTTYTDPKVIVLGERHGPIGPLVWTALMCHAGRQERAGEFQITLRTLSHELFSDAETVAAVIATAEEIRLCEVVNRDAMGMTLRLPTWERYQATGRKARQRARDDEGKKPHEKADVTESHGESRDVTTDRQTDKTENSSNSARVAPVHQPILSKLSEVAFARNLTDPKVEAVVEVNVAFAQLDLEAEAAKFAAYWTSGPGAKRGLDDVAWRWRTWLESAKEKPGGGNARSTVADDLKRLEREHAAALAEEARA
jgi:hypothetical protein